MMVLGFLLALWMYILDTAQAGANSRAEHPLLYRFLLNKWYFDELYDRIFVRPAMRLGRFLWKVGDGRIIDGLGPDGIAARVIDVTRGVVRLQTGYVYHYAFAMLIGVAALFTCYLRQRSSALMLGLGILSGLLILPLVGAAFILTLRGDDDAVRSNARWAALVTTIATFLLSLVAWARFDLSARRRSSSSRTMRWLADTIRFKLGVDGFSMPFVLLTTFLMPFCILASWDSIETRVKEYMVAFLVLETTMIGVFVALDLVLFYLFFEAGLIPMFLIIGIWGGKRRIYASFKFFLYTLLGSVLMLLAIMAMYWDAGTTDIPTLLQHKFAPNLQTWLWLAFFASFAVKMPMWPVHTWLPDAHVEAPTAGSVILAAILLKMGGYGFIRFSLPMFPDASTVLRAARLRAVDHRHHLHLPGRAGAGGHEEAHRLFVGGAHGLRHHGPLHHDPAGHPGRDVPDDLARPRLGRALPLRRRHLRPDAHPRDRGLRRAREPDAALCASPSWCSRWPMSACPARRASSASS